MAYERQHVLPRNFQPPSLSGLGLAPPRRPIRAGDVPAYPPLLPTLSTFTTAGARGYARFIPSLPPTARAGAPLWRPIAQAGRMPARGTAWAWGSPQAALAGLNAYTPAASVLPLTWAGSLGIRHQPGWGLGSFAALGAESATGYRPVGLGCPGCATGVGQVELGTATLPLIGDVDWKTILLVVGGLWIGSKIFAGGRRVTAGVKAGVRAAGGKKK